MLAYLSGKIKYQTPNWLILDVNGVGYKVYINSKIQDTRYKKIPNPNNQKSKTGNWKLEIGNSAELYTYNHIREDRSELYGFKTIEELQFFELLIGVNGVGPKMAMNIMSNSDLKQLQKAISSGDSSFFKSIGGVGNKIAAKIIVELKNKIGGIGELNLEQVMEGGSEIVDAMTALGYKKHEVIPYIGKLPIELKNTQEKVKWLLKRMSN